MLNSKLVIFVCEGEDEAEALKTLVEAVENGLGE
jgi:phosphotransferase system HPr-like phosphotransfer protein